MELHTPMPLGIVSNRYVKHVHFTQHICKKSHTLRPYFKYPSLYLWYRFVCRRNARYLATHTTHNKRVITTKWKIKTHPIRTLTAFHIHLQHIFRTHPFPLAVHHWKRSSYYFLFNPYIENQATMCPSYRWREYPYTNYH